MTAQASACSTNECIEVDYIGRDLYALRSNDAPADVLFVTRGEIDAFVKAWQAGQFDQEER